MNNRSRLLWMHVLLCNILMRSVGFASPVYIPKSLSEGTGRNIRHLPCISRGTGETGVCMFAFTCVKANGTHLGTCIDRFYFGSCCKINEEPDIFPQDNTIDETPASGLFLTTHSTIGSNDIPEYFTKPKPKPKPEKKPLPASSIQNSSYGASNTRPTSSKPQKLTTKRPILLVQETTPGITGLSTFQTVQNGSKDRPRPMSSSTTLRPLQITNNGKPHEPFVTITTIVTTIKPFKINATKPLSSTQAPPTTVQRPNTIKIQSVVSTVGEKLTTHNPLQATTSKPSVTTTKKTPLITRFPSRNTTTSKPTQTSPKRPTMTSTKRPITTTTRRPTSTTTKKSGTLTRIPITTTRSPQVTSSITRPISTTEKIHTLPSTFSESHRPSNVPTENTQLVTGPKPPSTTEEIPYGGFKPTTKKSTVTEIIMTTTSKPSFITTKPFVITTMRVKPTPHPTKIISTPKSTLKPQQSTTERTNPTSSLASKPISSANKPKPSVTPTEPTTKPSISTSAISSSSDSTHQSSISPLSTTSNEIIFTNDSIPSNASTVDSAVITNDVIQSTLPPTLVTWTSNANDVSTKAPNVSSSTSKPEEPIPTEWIPLTTPDGWIMIPAPSISTDKPETEKPKPTYKPLTTVTKPTTSSTTTGHVTTTPMISTILPTIATTTTSADFAVPMDTFNMSDYKQVCGRRLFRESRIVGGEHSSFGKWPWQISLRQWRTSTYLHKCGAALLNENWAITAAHCVENVAPSDLLLRIGEHDLANEDEPYGFQERRVQIVASHPQFDPRTFEYDLALLRFYEPLSPFQPNSLPICVPDDDENYVGHTAYVTGWGRLYEDGPLPSTLQEVSVPVINNTVCESMYRSAGYIEHIPNIFICAGWRKGGFDSCEGDSGGPMVIQRPRDKRWILAGVISWGIGCAEPNQPGVYTRISEFREWINQILQF